MFQLSAKEVLEQYPYLENMLREGAWRKYELQDALGLTRGEVDMVLSVLTSAGYVESTSLGWKWKGGE